MFLYGFLSGIWYYLQFITIYRSKTKLEPVDSINFFNDTLLITVMFVSVLKPNTTFCLSNRRGSIWGVIIYRRKTRVCNQYTRQDCPMGIKEKILQF